MSYKARLRFDRLGYILSSFLLRTDISQFITVVPG